MYPSFFFLVLCSGGGIYRKTFLHSAPPVHIETDGIYAVGKVASADITAAATPALGVQAASATVAATAELVNAGSSAASVTVVFELFDADGNSVAKAAPAKAVAVAAAPSSAEPAMASTGPVSLAVGGGGAAVELWSVARPYLYTLVVTLDSGDSRNVSVGLCKHRRPPLSWRGAG